MNRRVLLSLVILILAGFAPVDTLRIGSKAPLADQPLLDISGKTLTLAQAKGPNGLLVMFSCNTCPWVAAWENRFNTLSARAKELGIGMIALNANEAYRGQGDSMDDMKRRAADRGYTFPYALDRDSRLADAFGATRTPEVFLFDRNLLLVYTGAIDDNARNITQVQQPYLLNAMAALAQGQGVSNPVTRSLGCEIKRKHS
jgi:peroxiredoxin